MEIGKDWTYLKSGVYMIVSVIDNSKTALIAAINRGHLVEKNTLDWGPFGGSFTLSPREAAKIQEKYPGIVFKGDSAHQDKLAQDAKIYFPGSYNGTVKKARKQLKKLFDNHDRIEDAFLTEFREEAFEEEFQDNTGKTYSPPLIGMKPNKVIKQMNISPFAHTTLDYSRTHKYDKHKDCRYLKVSLPEIVFNQLKKSDMITVLSEKNFSNNDANGIQLTDVMHDGYKAAIDNGIIKTSKKIYTS